jgi:hypothetical protein
MTLLPSQSNIRLLCNCKNSLYMGNTREIEPQALPLGARTGPEKSPFLVEVLGS